LYNWTIKLDNDLILLQGPNRFLLTRYRLPVDKVIDGLVIEIDIHEKKIGIHLGVAKKNKIGYMMQ